MPDERPIVPQDERLLVLRPDPRVGGATAPRTGSGMIAIVIVACVVLALVLLVLSALAIDRWIDRHRNALKDVSASQAGQLPPAPARSIPPPDPMKANATLRGNPGAAFGADNYPVEALRRGEQGRTVARLSIDASGTPIRCVLETSSGSASLDEATCRIGLRSVRFDPARDSAGVPKASEYKLPVRWQIP